MRVSEELWDRVGEFLEEIKSHYSVKSQPKVRLLSNTVVLEIDEYDFTYPEIQHLEKEFENLEQTDRYDVNTNEGFRFILKEGGE